jgi:hypothetical protein
MICPAWADKLDMEFDDMELHWHLGLKWLLSSQMLVLFFLSLEPLIVFAKLSWDVSLPTPYHELIPETSRPAPQQQFCF